MKNIIFLLAIVFFTYCKVTVKERSNSTGWDYNNPNQNGYLSVAYDEQETGPGLILVKGGYFELKNNETTKEVLIPAFYMDVTEISNEFWVDYMFWTKRTFTDFPLVYENTKPNTKVWLENGVYNEPMRNYYLEHPSYQDYPVVGVSWLQANNYCKWRTDRVNEYILIREGILLWNNDQQNEPFTTSAYLAGQYANSDNPSGQLLDLDPSNGRGSNRRGKIKRKDLATRIVNIRDGILLPKYRLPTAAEWEFASVAPTTQKKKIFPWNGGVHKNKGASMNNEPPTKNRISYISSVNSHWPNDYGLYNMNRNVSEWVMDTYLENKEISNYSPFSGELISSTPVLNSNGNIDEKLAEAIYDIPKIIEFTEELETATRKQRSGVITDSLDLMVINFIQRKLDTALLFWNGNKKRIASKIVRKLIDKELIKLDLAVREESGFEDFQFEIINNFMNGISQYVLYSPGSIMFENITCVESSLAKNKMNEDYMKFIPSLQFDLDKNKKTDNRIFKGKNWRDSTELNETRYLNKYLSSSTIGFRCAMDRLGAVK
ncbi:MAG: SUMF1/EgtB/PvdO family nonheme iron enzyme [Flavobacteriales bacterium]